jgi:dTDP-4-amino-4,6-dideoxygalactose transaminase
VNAKLPAVLGGEPMFASPLNIVAPVVPRIEEVGPRIAEILASGQLTNDSRYVREFEAALESRLGVPAVTMSNGTWSLVLAMKALGIEGEVIVPSYTYCASAHAIRWAGATPVFADVLPDTYTVNPDAVRAAITPRTTAILAVHIYGHPCEIDELTALADEKGLALLFDAAHAFGATYRGGAIGTFGRAESFSFHATKTLPVGEGGCVSTGDRRLADQLRLWRKFGDPGNEDSQFAGTNAKMQEFNAILGLAGLNTVDDIIARRRGYAAALRERLSVVPGLRFQEERSYVRSNAQNFAVLVDEGLFGLSRDELHRALAADNVRCRRYFYPPVHRQKAYAGVPCGELMVTSQVADAVLCLPFYSHMTPDQLDGIGDAFAMLHAHAPRVRNALQSV